MDWTYDLLKSRWGWATRTVGRFRMWTMQPRIYSRDHKIPIRMHCLLRWLLSRWQHLQILRSWNLCTRSNHAQSLDHYAGEFWELLPHQDRTSVCRSQSLGIKTWQTDYRFSSWGSRLHFARNHNRHRLKLVYEHRLFYTKHFGIIII